MNFIKPWFLGRLLREKVLVLALLLVGALIWLSSASKALTANMRAFRMAEASLLEQSLWLNDRESIERLAHEAAANLDASKTYNATSLVSVITGMATRAGLAVNTEAPRTQRSPQFAIHTVQVTTRKAELAALLRFYQELSSKAPYLGLEQVSVQGDRGNPGMVNVNMQIASVELLSGAAGK